MFWSLNVIVTLLSSRAPTAISAFSAGGGIACLPKRLLHILNIVTSADIFL
jgi:hypothetical protein